MSEVLHERLEGGILLLRINRPEAKNALSVTIFEDQPPFTSSPVAAEFAKLYHERAQAALGEVRRVHETAVPTADDEGVVFHGHGGV